MRGLLAGFLSIFLISLNGAEAKVIKGTDGYWTLFAEGCSELETQKLESFVLDPEVRIREGRRTLEIWEDGYFEVIKFTAEDCPRVSDHLGSDMGEKYCGPVLKGTGQFNSVSNSTTTNTQIAVVAYSSYGPCIYPACSVAGNIKMIRVGQEEVLEIRADTKGRACSGTLYQYYMRPPAF